MRSFIITVSFPLTLDAAFAQQFCFSCFCFAPPQGRVQTWGKAVSGTCLRSCCSPHCRLPPWRTPAQSQTLCTTSCPCITPSSVVSVCPEALCYAQSGLSKKCSCSLLGGRSEDVRALPFPQWGAAAGLVMEMRDAGPIAVPTCTVFSLGKNSGRS